MPKALTTRRYPHRPCERGVVVDEGRLAGLQAGMGGLCEGYGYGYGWRCVSTPPPGERGLACVALLSESGSGHRAPAPTHRLHNVSSNHIAVYERESLLSQQFGDGAFAGGDAACDGMACTAVDVPRAAACRARVA